MVGAPHGGGLVAWERLPHVGGTLDSEVVWFDERGCHSHIGCRRGLGATCEWLRGFKVVWFERGYQSHIICGWLRGVSEGGGGCHHGCTLRAGGRWWIGGCLAWLGFQRGAS